MIHYLLSRESLASEILRYGQAFSPLTKLVPYGQAGAGARMSRNVAPAPS
jgi:hypothetical protein